MTPEERDEAHALYARLGTVRLCAAETGVSWDWTLRWLRKAGVKMQTRGGYRHGKQAKDMSCDVIRFCTRRPLPDGEPVRCTIHTLGCDPCLAHYSRTGAEICGCGTGDAETVGAGR